MDKPSGEALYLSGEYLKSVSRGYIYRSISVGLVLRYQVYIFMICCFGGKLTTMNKGGGVEMKGCYLRGVRPANNNVVLMLAHRLRRWPKVKSTLY